MIGALKGSVEAVQDQTIVIMCHGVGYQIYVPNAALFEVGATTQLCTYLAVRETALDLYGFTTQADKELFELLLKVPKIGPKSALDVMTKSETSLLFECIQTEDPSRLHKLAGIGKKTCENIVTNLKDKIESLSGQPATTDTKGSLNQTQVDAIDALVSLGYDPKTARTEVLSQDNKDLSVSDLVAAALK